MMTPMPVLLTNIQTSEQKEVPAYVDVILVLTALAWGGLGVASVMEQHVEGCSHSPYILTSGQLVQLKLRLWYVSRF